jgi:type I restriction enzyme S subunit
MGLKPGYKRTEVGVIPEEWDVKPLSSVLTNGLLGGNYPNQDREANYPLMKMGNISRGYIDISKVEYITPTVAPDPKHRLRYGDVLFNTRNTLDLVGKVAIWRDELPVAYYNSNLMRLEFDPQEICSNEYANYALNSEGGVARLRALATGTTSVAAIYTRDLLRMLFVVPPPTEQGAIAGALSDVDALIGALDQLIAKKRDLKQASMQQLLTGQKRLPGFSGDWEVKRLATVCAMKSGQGITDANIDGFSKFPCYGGNGLRGFTSRFTHNGCHALIGRQGALCGNVLSVEGMFFASEHAIVVTAFPQTDIHWLAYVLEKMRLNQYSESSAQPGLSVAKLLNLDLAVPPSKGEQTAIAEVLSDMDAEIAALERRRDKTRALKQGMMQELLTGRTRLVDSPRSYGQERL